MMAGKNVSPREIFSALTAATAKPVNDLMAAVAEKEAAPLPPAAALSQLVLDEQLQKEFGPVLQKLGFDFKEKAVLDSMAKKRTLNVACSSQNPQQCFFIISIPKEILEKPGQYDENSGSFLTLQYLFKKNNLFFIISRNLASMHQSFGMFLQDWFETKKIKGDFITWETIEGFLSEPPDDPMRIERVQQMFKLESFLGPSKPLPSAAAPTALTPAETDAVAKIMAQQADDPFVEKPQIYFSKLVDKAELPRAAEFKAHWTGTPDDDARTLLRVTAKLPYPKGHSLEDQYTLGWVLKAILGNQPSNEDSQAIIRIILSHNLISDPDTLQDLQGQLASTET